MTNALGQPDELKSVGLSSGLVIAFNSAMSDSLNDQLNTFPRLFKPVAHSPLSEQTLVPNPKFVVGLTEQPAPFCITHLKATSSLDLSPYFFPICFKTGLLKILSFGPGSPTAPYANVP